MKKGFTVNIEKGAGVQAKFRDEDYLAAGGHIVDGNKAWDTGKTKNIFAPKSTTWRWFSSLDILLKVRQPMENEIPLIRDNSTLISFLYPG